MPRESTRSPHRETLLKRRAEATSVAIFCDFDGTFSVQDVGSTLARRYLGAKREDLWARFAEGEFTPWSYNIELFEGFRLPQAELDEFLAGIDIDPGGVALIEWCRKTGASFEVLSDGFDYNLDKLQEINAIRFDYASNHLRYEGDEWVIAPGAPNPGCECGTGTCKRGIIDAARAARKGCFCVHVGNGRVSDLCGAMAADLAFAKDTLATALDERDAPYEPYDDLNQVVAGLDALEREAEAVRS